MTPRFFSADFHSGLIARSRKPIKYMLKTLAEKMQAAPNRPQKQTVDPATSNSNTLIDSAVTVNLIHVC